MSRPADLGEQAPAVGEPQSVSICIPSFNRCRELEHLLESLRPGLVGEDGVNITVLLDGSTDDSMNMLDTLGSNYPVPLVHQWCANGGRSMARNRLVDLASGEALWFLDDDMKVTQAAVTIHLEHCRSARPELLFGPCVLGGNDPLADYYTRRWAQTGDKADVSNAADITFANTSGPSSIFARYRFDESFKGYGFEDYELAARMISQAVTFRYCREAVVEHVMTKSSGELLSDLRDEGRNRLHLRKLHPELGDMALDFTRRVTARPMRWLALRGHGGLLWATALIVDRAARHVPGKIGFQLSKEAQALARFSGAADVPDGERMF